MKYTKPKLKIALDIDDTLGDFVTPYLNWYNRQNNTHHQFTDIDTWNKLQNIDSKGLESIFEFYNTWEFRNLPAYPEAQKCLYSLDNQELIAITMRPRTTMFDTYNWIGENYGNLIKDVHFGVKDKGDLCGRLKVDIMIEDALHNAHKCSQHKVVNYLLDKPWNKGETDFFTLRFKDWRQLDEHFKRYNLKKQKVL